MSAKLTIFFIVEPPHYEILACNLVASIRNHFTDEVECVGYCPEHRMDEILPDVLAVLKHMNCEVRPMKTKDRFEPEYPHGNKILACLEPRNTEYSMFVDSDVLFIAPVSSAEYITKNKVSASVAASMLWEKQSFWADVYNIFDMPVPEERVDLMRTGRNVIPYYSSGLVVFPENKLESGKRFPEIWYETATQIDRELEHDARRPYLDQISLPLAIARSDLTWNQLPENRHYIMGGKLRGQALPEGEDITTIHYRNTTVLKEAGLINLFRRELAKQIGVRYVRQFKK